ncbi:MAG: hypothetical protein K2Y22_04980 [Candidatus Obscuribacterales bacterium]|nr:hypothetical protein [Candidatus Obscuribacterales bacterium]
MMTIGRVWFSRQLFAALAAASLAYPAQAVNVLTVPGKPTKDDTAFAIVSKDSVKRSHKKITIGEYVFVPQVGKCWNVGAYKLKRGNKVLAQGLPDEYWPNSTYFTVIAPVVVSKTFFPPRKLGVGSIGDFASKIPAPLKVLAPGFSAFGSGSPEIIIERANCGAKCLYEYSIFSLGSNFKKLAKIETGNDSIEFIDIGGDGSIEGIGVEDTFSNWNFSSATSPRIKVILRIKDGKLRLATDLMKAPVPTAAYMKKIIAETKTAMQPPKEGDAGEGESRDSDKITMPFDLPTNMLELIYSGNGKSAWEFLDEVWPKRDLTFEGEKDPVTKKQFVESFKKQLATSPYWNDVKAINGW